MNSTMLVAQLLPATTPEVSPAIWDFLLVGGVIFGLAVIIFVVTAISRKAKRSKRRRKRGPEILRNSEEYQRNSGTEKPVDRPPRKGRRKKHHHRHHETPRHQLPTLAESGGLPPRRNEDSTPNPGH